MDEAGSTITPLFLGLLISMALWGISCLQAWNYFCNHSKDSSVLKAMVTVCCIGDTVHQALISHTVYTLAIVNFSNADALRFIPISLPLSVAFLEVTALATQGYFIWRIWKLSKQSLPLTGVAVAFVLAKLGCTINYTFRAMQTPTWFLLNEKMDHMTTSHVALDVASDVFISGVLCYLLQSSRTQYKATNHVITRLIVLTTTTGSLTGFMTVAMLVVHLCRPQSLVYFGLYFVLGRLYVNSLLAALNIRAQLRRRFASGDIELGPWSPRPGSAVGFGQSESITIKVDTVQERSIDIVTNPKEVYLSKARKGGSGQGNLPA